MTSVWPHGDPRAVVRAIVADERYASAVRVVAPERSWFDIARDWVVGIVRSVLHRLDRALGAHNAFETAIGFGVIAGVVLLVGWAGFLLARSLRRARRSAADASSDAIALSPARSAAELHAAARAAARDGRYRAAAALLFASAVRRLDEAGRLAYDPARTPGEYRRLLRDPLFDGFATDAVIALYAAAEPSDDIYRRMSGQYERLFDTALR